MPNPVTITGPVHITLNVDTAAITDPILAALTTHQGAIMTALEDLQAADTALDAEVTALVTEQATFLTDIAAKLAAAGVDPAALATITADITAQSTKLTDLAAAQTAADPGPPAA